MRTAALAAALLTLSAGAALAQSGPMSLEIDHAQRVQLNGQAASVIVGNPDIADVTVVDANTLFITGKGYGSTQVVAVDQIGRTIFTGEIVVTAPRTGHVRVWRGGGLTEMACANSCAPSIRSASSGDSAPAASAPVTP